jgi:predicted Zn-dependent peptidase
MRTFSIVLVVALALFGAQPARAATVVQQADPAAELVGTEVLLQAGLDRQTPKQNGLAALVAQCILRTPVNGVALEDAVNANSGSITYAIEPRDVRFYLEGLSGSYPALLNLLRTALAKPDFSVQTLTAARGALVDKIAQNSRVPLNVGIDMLNHAFYQDSDAGMPPYGVPATIAAFTANDAQTFYSEHYRRDEAIVSTVGNVQAVPNAAFTDLVSGLAPGVSRAVPVQMPKLPSTSRQLIARRDVPVPWLIAQYRAPDLRSKDFGAMLILTAFMQRTLADVSEVPAIATHSAASRGVGAYYNFDTQPANVIIYVDGGLGDPTRTFATALTVVNILGQAKMSGDLSEMKSFATGRLLEDTATLQDRAWLAGVFASRHMTGDYLTAALKAMNATTASDLQRVALQYLSVPTIALVLPRSQSDLQGTSP